MLNRFEELLTGGHPNSLGNTVMVVDEILADSTKLDNLYQCYFSNDEVVRLRVSSAMKRVCAEQPDWLVPYLDRLLNEVSNINQASAQWTLAQLFRTLHENLSATQKAQAISVLQKNLEESSDWIVQNTTMETLTIWSETDPSLAVWLLPRLEARLKDPRKSVAARAKKYLAQLQKR